MERTTVSAHRLKPEWIGKVVSLTDQNGEKVFGLLGAVSIGEEFVVLIIGGSPIKLTRSTSISTTESFNE